MSIKISGAPCCWGVDDPKNPYLPPWETVLCEAAQAGYKGIELGPYGYIPMDVERVGAELSKNNLTLIAGTIFDDLVSESNFKNLQKQVDDICSFITKLPCAAREKGQNFPTPYLVIIDWGHNERDYDAGHPERALRLPNKDWDKMMAHIRSLADRAWENYGVRSVIHPHAGGYIEFEDEINRLLHDIPYETAGLCLDTGHLYFSKMDPLEWLQKCAERLDYIHFKDIDLKIYNQVMEERTGFFDVCAKGMMCPIGQGIIDYQSILRLLKEINYHGYITIEQERDPRNASTSLQDVKQSIDYLESVGY
ncbi:MULTISPECIES: sugar phosphate isomerase/epimerase family protein [Heyndrickxia]|jgi:inosose dehydratase|uniref:TIM barrel protein n=1 Tax=Heyndrickxia faecalis TaxID=2824910 RepID=A0AAU7WK70_9BACI|nr:MULTISPECIES: TIM barrel protein [Heyndrickxia]APB37380.1 AP endonuclease [Heyndrickxia coagulans]MEC2224324.1 TIM barrel protein [Weizmannia sp. CD-2023]MEC2304140.1 TIM barrel protein [Weizmannia sp. CD-2023]MEC2339296.1 TIM barrel protein [Weizmannia sp. CD-2023]QPG53180.1 TIM barrel protein [Heyndrickxia coagulans]